MKIKSHIIYFIVVSFLLIYNPNHSYSQIIADSKINKNEIRIGEPIEWELSLSIPKNESSKKFIFPSFKDTITSKIEIIDASKIDTLQNSNNIQIIQKIKISAYDSGQFVLPSIIFKNKSDTTQSISTHSILITVHTVPTDTSEMSVKDIKPIFEEPFNIKWYMPLIIKIILALIVAGVVIYLIYYYTRKKSNKIIDKPKLPPHIIALEKLNNIKAQELWKQGKIKEYYSNISDTIREYIEGRYSVPAMEQTSYETLQSLKFKAIDNTSKEKIKSILEIADLVKFAKYQPIEQDHIRVLQDAFDFVNETKLEPIDTSNKKE